MREFLHLGFAPPSTHLIVWGVTFSTGWNRTDTTSHHNCPTKPFEGSAANRGGSPAHLYWVGFFKSLQNLIFFFATGPVLQTGFEKIWQVEKWRISYAYLQYVRWPKISVDLSSKWFVWDKGILPLWSQFSFCNKIVYLKFAQKKY